MTNTQSQRTAYGETLAALGQTDPNIVVLEADLSKSTMGALFGAAHPARFYEMGIAEANMASVAAGLALTGRVPFMATFAVFATGRCYDQLRTSVCIPALNVKVCGSSAGLSDYGDGSTHQSVEDIAIMRALPNMQVFCPADAAQTAQIVTYMAQNPGPMYLRVNRNDLPAQQSAPFVPGKVYTLREGADVAIFATGVMVSRALQAAEALQAEGVKAGVYNVPSLKPIDEARVAEIARGAKAVVTAEEHGVAGGLGSIICEILCEHAPKKVVRVGVEDRFGTSAQNYGILLEGYGLTAQAVQTAAHKALAGT